MLPDRSDPEKLRDQFHHQARKGTDFIDIIAKHPNQAYAKQIANAVAETYASICNARERKRSKDAMKALEEELALQSEEVSKARADLLTLCKEYSLPIHGTASAFLPSTELTFPPRKKDGDRFRDSLRQHNYEQGRNQYLTASKLLHEMKARLSEDLKKLSTANDIVTIHQRAR